ncbi:histidine--tRNA ligase [Patescibacteria group bacterium]|nr:histidine--tRNA ligase [Patescibacteria group bacterium]
MADTPSTEPYKGVRDFYPADWRRLAGVFKKVRGLLESYGYEEYNASPLERSELYESKGNEEIINEQTYTFTDRGDRRVTLRPEMTPTLARMVSAKRRELPFPLRWYNIGNRFRYERPQRGRLREFFQTDIDLVGLPEGDADIEIVSLASAILKTFGAKETDFIIRINSRKLLAAASKAAGLDDESLRVYWQLLDKRSKMTPEAFEEARRSMPGDPLKIVEDGTEPAVAEEKRKLDALIDALAAGGVGNAVYDPGIVRGFDYYTGVIFEVFDTDIKNPRALFGGGRYDGLVALFGGDPIPAVGFAFGDVTFIDFLETHGLLPGFAGAQADLYLGTPTADRTAAQDFARALREQGVRVFVNLTDKSLSDQIKDAVKRGIPYFAAVGSEEAKSGMLKLKTLFTGAEESLPVDDVASRILS